MQNFQLKEHGYSADVVIINEAQQLSNLCQSWLKLEAIAVDTEFDRTNTFFHNLALLQINDGKAIYLIDPLQLTELEPLAEVFASKELLKVLHSCSEDVEALFNAYGFQFNALFDSQIACAILNKGASLGYLRMIELLEGISLDKGHTKTDWLRRPLTQEQLVYAAQDVQFLLPAYFKLRDQLLIAGHFEYVLQDGMSIYSAIAKPVDYSRSYLRVKGAFKLNRQQTNRLYHIASWREQYAREHNIPKTFIFRDPQLIDICLKSSPKLSDLLEIGSNRGSIRRYGTQLLTIIEKADLISAEEWPQPVVSFHKVSRAKVIASKMKSSANQLAIKEQLPQEVLSNKRLIEYYILKRLGYAVRINRFWSHWREALLEPVFSPIFENYHQAD